MQISYVWIKYSLKNPMLITIWGCSRIYHLNMFCFARNRANSRSMHSVAWSFIINIPHFRKSFLIITNHFRLALCLHFYPTLRIHLFLNNLYFSEDNQCCRKEGRGTAKDQRQTRWLSETPGEDVWKEQDSLQSAQVARNDLFLFPIAANPCCRVLPLAQGLLWPTETLQAQERPHR